MRLYNGNSNVVLGKNIFSGRRGSNSNYGGRTQDLTGQLKGKIYFEGVISFYVRDIIGFPCGNVGKRDVFRLCEGGGRVRCQRADGLHRKEIGELRIDEGISYAEKAGIREIVIHAPYIINLGNMEKPEMFDFGVEFLAKEVKRAAAFHSKVLVLHPGSSLSAGVEASVEQIAKGLNLVLDADDSEVNIALETMAGKGSEVGRTFEELRMIYDRVERKDRLRVCFDTCHVNDAGYDLVNDYEGVLAQFDMILGLNQIAVIHVNDSLNPLGSHKDRHANIGQGTIGYETLHRIVHDDRFTAVPKILETPWLCAEGGDKKTIPPYKQEIAWLKA